MKNKTFRINLIDTFWITILYGDKKWASKILDKTFPEESPCIDDTCDGVTVNRNHLTYIWVGNDLSPERELSIFIHESIHAITDLMSFLGMDIRDKSGNELLAYWTQTLLSKFKNLSPYRISRIKL